MKIEKITSTEILKKFEEESALTLEGISEESIPDYRDWLVENCGLKEEEFFIVKGAFMNSTYGLKGNTAYPNDLTIVLVELKNLNVPRTVIARFSVGARWFDDVVANNRMHNEGGEE